jgi:hypothetical protein
MIWRRQLSWSPRLLEWRVSALFMVGATLFAAGSFPAYSQAVPGTVLGVTFVVGAIFFTSAAYSQFLEIVNRSRASESYEAPPRFRLWAWQPARILWWATVVQLTGTLLFNVSTIDAMADSLDVQDENRLVWAPDMFGSIAFIIASHLAWRDTCGSNWCVRRDDSDWWIAVLNYLGSIFFITAAIASFTLPTTGEVLNITLVNLGTFAGAVCFFAGAYLLLPPKS